MSEVTQQFIDAISLGGVYALLALGLAVVFSIFGLINFAHGELVTIGGYGIVAGLSFGLPFFFAALLGVLLAGIAALVMERVVFRPLRGAGVATLLLASLSVAVALQILYQQLISVRPQAVRVPDGMTGVVGFLGFDFGVIQLVSIAVTLVSLLALVYFLFRTDAGISMRAAAEDFNVTQLMGVRADRVIASAFLISGLLAGAAAVIWVSMRGSVDSMMGLLPMFKAFIATIIGGLGSLPGAVVGGFVLAFLEVILQAYLPSSISGYQSSIIFAGIIVLLMIRPQGILGKPVTA